MKHLKTIFSVLALVLAVSCAKTPSATCGQVIFSVSSNDAVADVTKSNVSDYTALPKAADFTITITGEDYTWTGKISDWTPETVLTAGEYSVAANYGDIEVEGFDKPFFTGTADFTVKGGEQTSVSIPVSLGNAIVRMTFTEAFNNYYPDYTFKLSRDGQEIAVFEKGETRAAFVDPWKFKLEGTLIGEMKTSTFSKEYSNLLEATSYTFNFDVTNVGGGAITIKFNDTVETIELGDHELND
jgi:hypothetical protein